MGDGLADHDGAVRVVAEVYELIKTHQPLLQLVPAGGGQRAAPLLATTPALLAQNLLSEALRALNVALSVMTKQQQEAAAAASASIKAEPRHSSSSSANSGGGGQVSAMRRTAKRRRAEDQGRSWVYRTAVPHEDGYQWRKYGQKKIHGTPFPRSYFRCTYKDDIGCLATKQIQQHDNDDPPMFQVTYTNDHTCTATRFSPAAANHNLATGADAPAAGHAAAAGIAAIAMEEAQAALPSLVDTHHQILPIFHETQWREDSAAATNYYSRYNELGYHHGMGQMTTATSTGHEAVAGDEGDGPSFYDEDDPHLFLLYDSFKHY